MKNFADFRFHDKPEPDLVAKYQALLPEKLIQVWQEHGFGSIADGYLKIVNPHDFEELLKEVYNPVFNNPVVMFATAMADLIIWENNYTVLLNCRYGVSKVIESGFRYFLEDIYDKEFIEEELKGGNYFEAKKQLGETGFDECFGYFPLLGSGGTEKVGNLRKAGIKEHLGIIAQTLGKIA